MQTLFGEQTRTQPQPPQPPPVSYGPPRVVVTDVDMPFWSMVSFMIKWAFASIPAMIIISAVIGAIFVLFGTLGALGGAAGSLPR